MPDLFQIVTVQNGGDPHVQSLDLSLASAYEQLGLERLLHQIAGWEIESDDQILTCRKNGIERVLTITPKEAQ